MVPSTFCILSAISHSPIWLRSLILGLIYFPPPLLIFLSNSLSLHSLQLHRVLTLISSTTISLPFHILLYQYFFIQSSYSTFYLHFLVLLFTIYHSTLSIISQSTPFLLYFFPLLFSIYFLTEPHLSQMLAKHEYLTTSLQVLERTTFSNEITSILEGQLPSFGKGTFQK